MHSSCLLLVGAACRCLSAWRLIVPPQYPWLRWRLPEDRAHLIGQAATDATTLLAAKDNAGKTAADLAATPKVRETLQVRSGMPQHLRSRHFALHIYTLPWVWSTLRRPQWQTLEVRHGVPTTDDGWRPTAAHLPYELIPNLHCGPCGVVNCCLAAASRSL